MNNILKNISITIIFIMSLISSSQASESFSHSVLTLLDDPRNEKPWTLILNNQQDWEDFYNKPLAYMTFPQGEAPVAPKIDFERYQVLTGGLGVKNTGGFQLVVNNVRELDNELLVHVLVVRPSANCLTIQQVSYPSTTILVEKNNKPFKFVVSQLIDECL